MRKGTGVGLLCLGLLVWVQPAAGDAPFKFVL